MKGHVPVLDYELRDLRLHAMAETLPVGFSFHEFRELVERCEALLEENAEGISKETYEDIVAERNEANEDASRIVTLQASK